MTYRPIEIARRLEISSSTLRLWSNQFAPLLSDLARKEAAGGNGPVAQRRYTDDDLRLLTQAKEYLAHGLTYQDTSRRLCPSVPQRTAAAPDDSANAPPHPPQQDADLSLQETLEAKERTILALKESLAYMDVYVQTVLQEREDARARERLLQRELDRLRPQLVDSGAPLGRPWWKRLLALP